MIWGKIISFTDRGAQLGRRIAALLPGDCIEHYARGTDPSVRSTSLSRMVQQAMVDCGLIIFIGASGIAVRTIAPYLKGKTFDPAVLVADENGKFIISLISGHLGGANALAQRLAEGLAAQAVITTATDGRGIFAVDTWAGAHGCTVLEPERIRHISAALLRGEAVGMQSDYPVDGAVPRYIHLDGAGLQNGFTVSTHASAQPYENTLHLIPRILHLGIGCRKGTSEERIERAVHAVLDAQDIPFGAIRAAASIDLKRHEAGLRAFCARHGLPFETFSAEALMEVEGEFTASAFVQQVTGVDNVCERAALKSAGGRLICERHAMDGVTVAIAEESWRITF